jgi:hypothetical protein
MQVFTSDLMSGGSKRTMMNAKMMAERGKFVQNNEDKEENSTMKRSIEEIEERIPAEQ